MEAKINKVAEMIAASKRLVVFTGAASVRNRAFLISGDRKVSGRRLIPMISPLTDSLPPEKRVKKSGSILWPAV